MCERDREKWRGRDLQRKTAAKCSRFQNSGPKCWSVTGGNTPSSRRCICTNCTPRSGCPNEICKFLKALKIHILHMHSSAAFSRAVCAHLPALSVLHRARGSSSTQLTPHVAPRRPGCCHCCVPSTRPHATSVCTASGAAAVSPADAGSAILQRHQRWKLSFSLCPSHGKAILIMDHIAQRRLSCGISIPPQEDGLCAAASTNRRESFHSLLCIRPLGSQTSTPQMPFCASVAKEGRG